MSVFPKRALTKENVLVHTGPRGLRQQYDSPSLGKKSLGHPRGVYVGFIPSALGSVLTLSPDPTEGHSTLKVPSRLDQAGIDLIVTAAIDIDFAAALPSELLPDGVNVKARAFYSETGAATAQIVTETRTITEIVFTVGASPAALDLSTLAALGAVVAGTLSIAISVDGVGPDTITDDGNGNLVAAGTGLPLGGTVNYRTGALTGITSALTALSNVMATYTRCSADDEVLLCIVTGTPGSIAVNTTPPFYGAPDERDLPIAFPGCTGPYGFLESGAVEDLEAAVEILNEVIAARTDLQGVAHPDLKTRLDTDLGSDAMAVRLGKALRALRGNTTEVVSGVTEVNVSSSFGEFSRTNEPKITIDGGGDETTIGAVTDAVRNVCFATNDDDGDRIHDNETDRNVVIARLHKESDFLLDGVLTFTNAIATVVGSGSAFTSQVNVGDLLQGADGRFYEVQAVSSATQLTLANAYQGATSGSGGLVRRRFLLRFYTLSAGTETLHTISAAAEINFTFPAYMGVNTASFDAFGFMHSPGERNPVPVATTLVPGKVELANAGSPYAGSILLQNKGTPVPGGPFHTLNFTAGSIIELSAGVLDVVVIGGTGPTGTGGGLGPTGAPGVDGPDLDSLASFEPDIERPLGHGAVVTHNVSFGFDVAFLSGGISSVRDGGFVSAGEDWILSDLSLIAPQQGSVTVENPLGGLGGDQFVTLYLDAAGFS